MSGPRTLAIPCRAAGCPSLVGLTAAGDGAWRGTCSACGARWVLEAEPVAAPARAPTTPFAFALSRERTAAGLTQNGLAIRGGVERTLILRYESGAKEPSWSTLVRLCRVLPGLAAALAGEAERTAA